MSLRREPAVFLGFLAALLQLVSAFVFPLTDGQQGVLNAAFAAVAGVVVALLVSADKTLPLLVGLVQSVIAVGLAFGLDLNPEAQSTVLAVVAAGVAMFTRTQVKPALKPSVR